MSIVLQAFILTTAVFLGLTAYTLQSKRDFSKFGAGYVVLSMTFVLLSYFFLIFKASFADITMNTGQ